MDENTKKHIQSKLALLPRKPGCYLMKDKNGVIIYVGKAKNLKNRVNSYLISKHFSLVQKNIAIKPPSIACPVIHSGFRR